MSYQIASLGSGNLETCESRFGITPRATYNPGAERVTTLAGTAVFVGYPHATWTFEIFSVTAWNALLTLVGSYSGEVRIQTRTDGDVFSRWRALVTLPEPRTLARWGGHYRNVTLEFALLALLT